MGNSTSTVLFIVLSTKNQEISYCFYIQESFLIYDTSHLYSLSSVL